MARCCLVYFETIDAVKSGNGCVRLNKIRLTDGSYVYDVQFYDEHDNIVFTLSPANKKEADSLFAAIKKAK